MALAPLANALAVFLSPEIILVLRLLPPAALALGLALPAASRLGAVALMVRITALRKIQDFAMAALAPEGRLHRQACQPEPPRPPKPPRRHSPKSTTALHKTEPNEEELCRKAPKKIHRLTIRFSHRPLYPTFRSPLAFKGEPTGEAPEPAGSGIEPQGLGRDTSTLRSFVAEALK
jgi:hypothetical protein